VLVYINSHRLHPTSATNVTTRPFYALKTGHPVTLVAKTGQDALPAYTTTVTMRPGTTITL
jgi:hypothetical protein